MKDEENYPQLRKNQVILTVVANSGLRDCGRSLFQAMISSLK